MPILLLFPSGQALLILPLPSHWSAYIQSSSLEEVIRFYLNAQAFYLLHLPLPLTRDRKEKNRTQQLNAYIDNGRHFVRDSETNCTLSPVAEKDKVTNDIMQSHRD